MIGSFWLIDNLTLPYRLENTIATSTITGYVVYYPIGGVGWECIVTAIGGKIVQEAEAIPL